jgi:phosphatidylglycerophosphate synthase
MQEQLPPPEYAYRCDDRSVLLPLLNRFILEPMKNVVPESIHPNLITLAAFFLTLVSLVLVLVFPSDAPGIGVAGGLCILLYLILDNFDGKQAKRTGKSSAVGEYFDHGLDTFSSAAILTALFFRYEWQHHAGLLWLAAGTFIVSGAIFSYQKATGHLFFPKFSPLETGTAMAFLFFLSDIPDFRSWIAALPLQTVTFVMIAVLLMMLKDAATYVFKAGQITAAYASGAVILVAMAAVSPAGSFWHLALLVFFGIATVLQILRSHLAKTATAFPPLLIAVLPWLLPVLTPDFAASAAQTAALAMAFYAVFLFVSGVLVLKRLYRVPSLF